MSVHIGNDWDALLQDEWEKPYYQELRQRLIHAYQTTTVHPSMYEIFRALEVVSYADTKVVILGQDPYHGPGQAHGMSFSVKPGVQIPPSLRNIYKELHDDLGCAIPNQGYLMHWAEQGVLLLNATLTVQEGLANSHRQFGWSILTDRIVSLLGEREDPMVFLLWGRFARSKKDLIANPKHLVLESAHPSPLSASQGFFGSRPFSKANAFLVENGKTPIDWQIPVDSHLE